MWDKITAALGFVLTCIMAALLGKSYAQKKQAEKEVKAKEAQIKQEAKYKAEAHKIKEEIFKEAENEKAKIGVGDVATRFNTVNDILRKHN
ncbi:MAG: hypothetical protein IJT92_00930 [Spirochaetia bacterium]|nr:hypothetical protein [Spirochaetia bacterium]